MTKEPNLQKVHRTLLVLLCGFVLGVLFLGIILLAYRAERGRTPSGKGQSHNAGLPKAHAGEGQDGPPSKTTHRPGSNAQKQGLRPSPSKPESRPGTGRGDDVPAPPVEIAEPNMGVRVENLGIAGSRASVPVGGTISGRISLSGTAPTELPLPADPVCAKLDSAPTTTRFYAVDANGGLADVFVYIKEGLASGSFAQPQESLVIDQKGCFFTPYVAGLQTGQRLLVRNSDPVLHNVHVIPRSAANKESNKVQLPGSKDLEFSFQGPELFLTVKCDVHPWMFAYIGIVDHPFFAVSAQDGSFQLTNVPAGQYVVEAVHRKAGKLTQDVTPRAGAATTLEFAFEAK